MKQLLLLFVILLFSCKTDKNSNTTYLSENQKFIKKKINKIAYYANETKDSLKILIPILEEKSKFENNEFKAMVCQFKGTYFFSKSQLELALKEQKNALNLLKNSNADSLIAISIENTGTYFKRTGNYPKAIENYFKALKIYEKLKKNNGIGSILGNIGEVYAMKSDAKNAEIYLTKGLKYLSIKKGAYSYLIQSHNLANFYGMNGDFEKALKIDNEGIALSDSLKSEKMKTKFLNNKANCFMYSGKLDSAKIYFDASMIIDLKYKETMYIADTYANYAQLALFKNDFLEAEKQIQKAIAIQKNSNLKPDLANSYEILKNIYLKQNKNIEVIKTQELIFKNYKELISEKKEAALSEYNVVYETQEKEKQLILKDADAKKRNQLLIGLVIFSIFIGLFGFLIYRQQKLKNTQQTQAFELKQAINQIETQNKLQSQRLAISKDLHDNIGAQLTFIISSVETAKFAPEIENTKLGNKLTQISNFTKDTIIELRDTIWAMNSNEIGFEDLQIRISNFIEKANDAVENSNFKFNIDANFNDVKLSSIAGMNIYRTIQEAINNALKYAKADTISVSIDKLEDQINIEIADNGIGFDKDVIIEGNGLQNMQKRIEEIGGNFELKSEIEKGTVIKILV